MRIIENVSEMQQLADTWRTEGQRIALVPTMGFLHQGHLQLLRTARKLASRTVISIFVNPTQFAPNEDFDSYPRDLQRDIRLSTEEGIDLAFAPRREEMYPEGF